MESEGEGGGVQLLGGDGEEDGGRAVAVEVQVPERHALGGGERWGGGKGAYRGSGCVIPGLS